MSFLPAGVRYLAASTCTAIYLPVHPSTLPGLPSQDCLSLDAGPISLLLLDFFSLRSDTFFNLPELLSPSAAYLQVQNPVWLTGDAACTSFASTSTSCPPGNRLSCLHPSESRLASALPAHLGHHSIISPPFDLLLARERHPHLPTEISPWSNLRARNYPTCLLEKHLRHT